MGVVPPGATHAQHCIMHCRPPAPNALNVAMVDDHIVQCWGTSCHDMCGGYHAPAIVRSLQGQHDPIPLRTTQAEVCVRNASPLCLAMHVSTCQLAGPLHHAVAQLCNTRGVRRASLLASVAVGTSALAWVTVLPVQYCSTPTTKPFLPTGVDNNNNHPKLPIFCSRVAAEVMSIA
jgi:hypothetical protein